jgi:hypothetical protein
MLELGYRWMSMDAVKPFRLNLHVVADVYIRYFTFLAMIIGDDHFKFLKSKLNNDPLRNNYNLFQLAAAVSSVMSSSSSSSSATSNVMLFSSIHLLSGWKGSMQSVASSDFFTLYKIELLKFNLKSKIKFIIYSRNPKIQDVHIMDFFFDKMIHNIFVLSDIILFSK